MSKKGTKKEYQTFDNNWPWELAIMSHKMTSLYTFFAVKFTLEIIGTKWPKVKIGNFFGKIYLRFESRNEIDAIILVFMQGTRVWNDL